jgi:hypothetical protein
VSALLRQGIRVAVGEGAEALVNVAAPIPPAARHDLRELVALQLLRVRMTEEMPPDVALEELEDVHATLLTIRGYLRRYAR